MEFKANAVVLFCGLFGLCFIWLGTQRLVQMRREKSKAESAIWGTTGIALGCAFLVAAVWLMSPPPPDEKPVFDPDRPHIPSP